MGDEVDLVAFRRLSSVHEPYQIIPLLSKEKQDVECNISISIDEGVETKRKLYDAVNSKNTEEFKRLLENESYIIEVIGDVIVLCVKINWCEGLTIFEKYINKEKLKENINKLNNDGESALHIAAKNGCRICVEKLMDLGGNLALKNKEGKSAFYIVRHNIVQPVNFLCDIMDKQIRLGEDNSIDLDFRFLLADKEQMNVLMNIMETINLDQRNKFLSHPLIITFLRLKWDKVRNLYYLIILMYFLFVILFSIHVVLLKNYTNEYKGMLWGTFATSIILAAASLILSGVQIKFQGRHFRHYENYIHIAAGFLVFIVTIDSAFYVFDNRIMALNLLSYAVLLAWLNLLMYIGRLPKFGYYALLFGSVFKQICKVLAIFSCIIFGFTICFSVQFRDKQNFHNLWNSFVKTLVMMTGELDYSDMFPLPESNNASNVEGLSSDIYFTLQATSQQILFLIFVVITSITLINLMVGLSVNDVQSLLKEGEILQLIKKARFLSHYERIPEQICRVRLRPDGIEENKNISKPRDVGLSYWKLPFKLYDVLLEVAEKNAHKNLPISNKNIYDLLNNVQESLSKIKDYLETEKNC